LLNKAGACGELAQTRIAPACARSQADVNKMEQLIASLVRELQVTMKRIEKQCATGLVIARSAGIEAAHGRSLAEVLRQIALVVTEVTDNIVVRVKTLQLRQRESVL
jgi:hypothetical protein